MNKNCVVCGKEFESKTIRAKYCCTVCKNHSRFNRTRSEWLQENNDLRNRVLVLYQEGKNDIQIADEIGKSISFVYKTRTDLGLKKQLTIQQRKVLECRQQGMCCVEIADFLNMERKNVKSVAKKLGMPFTKEEVERSIAIGKTKRHCLESERIKHSRDYIARKFSEWEYVSGFINSDDFVEIKCKECKTIVRKSATTLRHNSRVICPVCSSVAKQRKIKQLQRKREQAEKFEIFKNEFQQESFKRCESCGSLFFGRNRKYCSSECAKKIFNSTHKDKRIRKMRAVVIDKGITLEKLYQRDSGRCWICGEQCDYKDYETTKEGYFIVGGAYPSIDHVKPLSKGGLHSWENIKLAHHYCNTIKNDKVVCI